MPEVYYSYVDENSVLLYQNVRVEEPGKEKTFYFRRPNGNGGWEPSLAGVRRVPYRLPRLLPAIANGEWIFGCEGEKDVATLEAWGLVATSTKSLHNHAPLFAGARFALLYDADMAGRRIRGEVAGALGPVCADFRVVHLAPDDRDDGFDVTDWVVEGHGKDELLALVETTPSAATDGATLLDDIAVHLNRYVKMSPPQGHTLAVFSLCTPLAPRLDVIGYVHIYSPERECGKTVAMDAMTPICADSLTAGDASVAAIARSLRTPRTVFVDELDALLKGDKDRAEMLGGIFNQGYKRSGTYLRYDPVRNESVHHPVYGPKVFAGIRRESLRDTLRSRSIPILLERMSPDDEVEPFFERHAMPVATALRDRNAAWTRANAEAVISRLDELYRLRREDPVLSRLQPRVFEIWAPLVAICDVAGGEWPRFIRKAAAELMLGEDAEDRSYRERALANIYDIFEAEGGDRISSADIVEKLNKNPEWEWAEWKRGKGITQRQLAELLKDFRIRPKSVREGEDTFKGYKREWFEKVWKAYRIPWSPFPPTLDLSQPSQPNSHAALSPIFDPSQDPDVTDVKLGPNPDEIRIVTDVTDKTGGKGDGGAPASDPAERYRLEPAPAWAEEAITADPELGVPAAPVLPPPLWERSDAFDVAASTFVQAASDWAGGNGGNNP